MFETSIRHPHGLIGSIYGDIVGIDREIFTWTNSIFEATISFRRIEAPTCIVKVESEDCIHMYSLITSKFTDHLEFELKGDNILMRVFTKDYKVIEKGITRVEFRGYADIDYTCMDVGHTYIGINYTYMEERIIRSLLNTF